VPDGGNARASMTAAVAVSPRGQNVMLIAVVVIGGQHLLPATTMAG
jgi:hypothetical protein